MNDVDDLLQHAFDDLSTQAPHTADLAGAIRRRSRWRTVVTVAPVVAALAVIALVTASVWLRPGADTTASDPISACRPLSAAVLPDWATAGFSDPKAPITYVTSQHGDLVAIVFANPLVAPAVPDLGNKILWVANGWPFSTEPFTISGRVAGGTATMRTTVPGGPGPSIIDVPAAGCWHFDLTWGASHDSIDIAYSTS